MGRAVKACLPAGWTSAKSAAMTGAAQTSISGLVADTLRRARLFMPRLAVLSLITSALLYFSLSLPAVWGGFIAALVCLNGMQMLVACQLKRVGSPARTAFEWQAFLRLAGSVFLLLFVLGFLLLLTLLTTTLVVIGVMAGSGFDFDLAGQAGEGFEQAMAAYRQTPGWLICQGVFLFGLAAWVYAVARALPFLPGVLLKSRVIALEAFSWTRGRGVKILGALVAVMTLPVLIAFAAASVPGDSDWGRRLLLAAGLVPAFYLSGAFLGALSHFVPDEAPKNAAG